jgi:hypothetical protein
MYKYVVISIIIIIILIILIKYIDYYLYKYFYKLYIFEQKSNDIEIINKFNTNNNNKVISLSLFGDNPYYYNHAYKMKDDLPKYFPDWELRIYIHYKTPASIIKKFIEKGCQVIIIKQDNMTPSDSTFWRFLAAQDNIIFLCRDVDYQLNNFDYNQVNKWLKEDKTYFMKYLCTHSSLKFELLIRGIHSSFHAGFWGGRNRCVPNILEKINNYKYRKHWRRDELFLENIIWEEDVKNKGITIIFDYKMGKMTKKFIQPYIKIRQLEYDNPMEKYLKSQSVIGRLKKVFEYFE